MEKQENVNSLAITIVILIIIIIAMKRYNTYDKDVIQPKKNNDVTKKGSEENIDNKNNNENTNLKVNDAINVLSFYHDSMAIVYGKQVYVSVCANASQIDNLYGNGVFQTLVKTKNNYQEYNFGNSNVTIGNNNFKGMKLNITNVRKVFIYEEGQSMNSNYGLIMLKEDGTLSIISLYSLINGKTDVKKIEDLTNVTRIISKDDNGINTYAVTKDNHKINLNKYVPKSYKDF